MEGLHHHYTTALSQSAPFAFCVLFSLCFLSFFFASFSFFSSLSFFLRSLSSFLSYFNFSASSFFFFLSSNSISEKSSAVRALTPVILLVHFFEIAASSSGAVRISERSSGINPAGTNGFTIGEASVGDI